MKTAQDNFELRPNHYQVVSHAFATFTTRSFLEGDVFGKGDIVDHTKYRKHKNIPCDGQLHRVNPLSDLKQAVAAQADKTHFVVFSAGGDDLLFLHARDDSDAVRKNPLQLLLDIPGIQKRYLQILRQLGELKGAKPILMTQYRWDPK